VRFSNDDDIEPGSNGPVDTVWAIGSGEWNGKPGYSFERKAADAGEPGTDTDKFQIYIRDAVGHTVAKAHGKIDSGNNDSRKPPK